MMMTIMMKMMVMMMMVILMKIMMMIVMKKKRGQQQRAECTCVEVWKEDHTAHYHHQGALRMGGNNSLAACPVYWALLVWRHIS